MKRLMTFLFFLFSLFSISSNYAFADDIVVIVNENYPISSYTLPVIKSIYMGEKVFEGAVKIKPIDQKESSSIRKKFIEKVLSSTTENYKAYWIKKVFREGALPPAVKNSSKEVIESVINENGSIGYVWAEEVANKAGVKILFKITVDR